VEDESVGEVGEALADVRFVGTEGGEGEALLGFGIGIGEGREGWKVVGHG